MSHAVRTARQRREVAFYRRYAPTQQVESIDFAPVQGRERRPWNPYWYVYEYVRARQVGCRQRLLDFGCGIGVAALRFAYLGFHVDAFDLSRDNLDIGRRLAKKYDLTDRCTFAEMAAEQLDYPDDTFDVIVGIDILHHVEIPRAVAEAQRVLKPGGVAVFKEHVEVPVFDKVRNTALVRTLVPRDVSIEHHITEDERKLTGDDLAVIQSAFGRVEIKRFTVLSRLDRLIPRCNTAMRGRIQQLDHHLMRTCPPLARLGGTAVLICHK